jgi:hypothetical protein
MLSRIYIQCFENNKGAEKVEVILNFKFLYRFIVEIGRTSVDAIKILDF